MSSRRLVYRSYKKNGQRHDIVRREGDALSPFEYRRATRSGLESNRRNSEHVIDYVCRTTLTEEAPHYINAIFLSNGPSLERSRADVAPGCTASPWRH